MALVTLQRSPSPSNDPEEESAEGGEDGSDGRSALRHKGSLSESYFTVKGAALILPHSENRKASRKKHGAGEIQRHLQSMLYLLRPEDKIKVAIRLDGQREGEHRYMALVSTTGRQDTEESVILGLDCSTTSSSSSSTLAVPSPTASPASPRSPASPTSPTHEAAAEPISSHGSLATIGLVLPIWMGMKVRLSGDGGFSISVDEKSYLFKPVSVQAMWSAIQALNKALHHAEQMKYLAEGLSHTWIQYYRSKLDTSDRGRLTIWNLMEDVETFAPALLDFRGENENEKVKMKISAKLKEVMMAVDLDEATSLSLRKEVESALDMKLDQFRSYFDEELIRILGQMDAPSQILPFLYLGSEWNASNLEELQRLEIKYILNITREIDNFFTGMFHYYNVRLYDVPDSELLKYWPKTHRFINKARKHGSKVLVHCKMGVSRSASTVIAFIMKENGWPLEQAFKFVKERRSCVRPNKGFMEQLQTYEGILQASSKRDIFRSVSEQNILEEGEAEEGVENIQQGTFLGESLFQQMSGSDWPSKHLSPEEELLLKKGYSGDFDLTAMEPDFETDSRSADSMEESLPDMPSPLQNQPCGFDQPGQDGAAAASTDPRTRWATTVTSEKSSQSGFPWKAGWDGQAGLGDAHSTSRIKPDSSWIRLESPGESSTDLPTEEPMDVDGSNVQQNGGGGPEGVEFYIGSASSALPAAESKTGPSREEQTLPSSPPPRIVIEGAGESMEEAREKPEKEDVEMGEVEMGVYQYYSREEIPWSPGKVRSLQGFFRPLSADSSSKLEDRPSSVEMGEDERGAMTEAALLEVVGSLKTAPVMALCDSCMELSTIDTGEDEDGRPRSVYEKEDIPLTPGTVRRTLQEIEERQRLSGDDCDRGLFGLRSVQRSSSLREERSSGRSRSAERRRTCTPLVSPPPEREKTTAPAVVNLGFQAGESSTDDLEEMEAAGDGERAEETQNVRVYTFGEETVPVKAGMVRRHKAEFENSMHQRSLSAGSTSSLNSDGYETFSQDSPTPTAPASASEDPLPPDPSQPSMGGTAVPKPQWPAAFHHVHTDTTLTSPQKDVRGLHSVHTDSSLSSHLGDSAGGVRSQASVDSSESTWKSTQGSLWVKTDKGWRVLGSMMGETEGAVHQSADGPEVEVRQRNESQPVQSKTDRGHKMCISHLAGDEALELSKKDAQVGNQGSSRSDIDKAAAFPSHRQKRKSNFDPETLAMIREIGSAFVSTPTKVEEEESSGSSTSLVKHLVKNIEQQQKVPKAERKIVIIQSDSKRNADPGKRCSQDMDISTHQQSGGPGSHTSVPSDREGEKPASQQGDRGQASPEFLGSIFEEKGRSDSGSNANTSGAQCLTRVSEQPPSVVRHLVGRFETQSPSSDTSDGDQLLSGNTESSASTTSHHHGDIVCDIPVLLEELGAMSKDGGIRHTATSTKNTSFGDSSPRLRSESLSSGTSGAGNSSLPMSHASRRPRSAEHVSQYYPPGVRPYRQPWESEGGQEGEPKVRRLHGKSHPLTRLQPSTNRQGASPFNSTM